MRCAANLTLMTRHFSALVNVSGSLAAADRTGTAVHHVTVGSGLALEVVAAHYALETFALRCADNIDLLPFLEVCDLQNVANLQFARLVCTDFNQFRKGFYTRLFQMPKFGFCHARFFLRAKTDLNGFVAVALSGFNLSYRAWTRFNNSNRNQRVVCVENLSHTQFLTNKYYAHSILRGRWKLRAKRLQNLLFKGF